MTEMTKPNTAEVAARYLAVWNEPDPAARRAAVAELWAPGGTEFVDRGIQHHGHEELADRIAEAYAAFVGSGRFTVTGAGDVTRHDDIVTLTIQLTTPGGEVGWAARVFLLLGADGLIKEDYQLTVQPLAA
ncbi:MAG TPA: nuclear transport factor 2 family protein [Trebonia sp.]|nr:nuclear transport factor 2 family protein [Trebonia sp.]